MSLNAYRQTQSRTESHRASEYRLMGQVTHDLIVAKDQQLGGGELMQALHRNRAVWTVFGTLCAAPENQLPADLRARIVSLALWVDRHTSDVMRNGEVLDPLISVNTAIMEGLSVETVA